VIAAIDAGAAVAEVVAGATTLQHLLVPPLTRDTSLDLGALSQKDRNQLDGLVGALEKLGRRAAEPGNEDAQNHWARQRNGINDAIDKILRRHPGWRDPRNVGGAILGIGIEHALGVAGK
jgi:hypothetical protein